MKKSLRKVFGVFYLAAVLVSFACKGTPTTPAEKHPPVINDFSISPSQCKYKENVTATLSWNVSGVTSVTIDQGIGSVAATSSQQAKPTQTTTWTLTATNADGTASRQCTFTVEGRAVIVLASSSNGMTSYHCPKIDGIVRNDGNLTGWNVMISFQALNAGNTILDTAHGFPADLGDIKPGQSAVFEAIFFNLYSWSQIDHVQYTIDWLDRQYIGTRVQKTGRIYIH